MAAPPLPGDLPRPRVPEPLYFLAHRLGQLEHAYRSTAADLLEQLPSDDDLAVEVRRVLAALSSR